MKIILQTRLKIGIIEVSILTSKFYCQKFNIQPIALFINLC